MRLSPLILLTGCTLVDGPHTALQQAQLAFANRDLAAFERAVDLEAVAPAVARLCGTVRVREDFVERQFQTPHPLADLARTVGEPWLEALVEQSGPAMAQQVREDFGTLDLQELCEGVALQEPGVRAVWRGRQTGQMPLPVTIYDKPYTLDAWFSQVDGAWKLTGLDASPAVTAYTDTLKAQAAEQARLLARDLGPDHPERWRMLRAYLERNPDDTATQKAYDDAAAPFVSATPPLGVEGVQVELAGLLGMKREVSARVRNPTERAVAAYAVRFTFFDDQGEPTRATDGDEAMTARVSASIPPGGVDRGAQVLAGGLRWPRLAQGQGTVVEVTWANGERWVHPAVEAGVW
ncbi:MAG: hypothetical protein H6739_38980 [Alphaproteobacteria bacterium]|nr:hypothetical protein [Alphaproteobacteria bacterium]